LYSFWKKTYNERKSGRAGKKKGEDEADELRHDKTPGDATTGYKIL